MCFFSNFCHLINNIILRIRWKFKYIIYLVKLIFFVQFFCFSFFSSSLIFVDSIFNTTFYLCYNTIFSWSTLGGMSIFRLISLYKPSLSYMLFSFLRTKTKMSWSHHDNSLDQKLDQSFGSSLTTTLTLAYQKTSCPSNRQSKALRVVKEIKN